MKALSYLLITQLKNKILSLRKKPAFLILYGFILLVIVLMVIMMLVFDMEVQKQNYADERILYLFITGIGLFFVALSINAGLSTGSTLFSMADVGLLFVAPISSRKILFYGLLSTMGKTLLTAIFIFYQINNLKMQFGYGLKEIMALFFIYTIMIFFSQLLSIAIYIFSNGNPLRKKIVKGLLYASLGAILLGILIIQRSEQLSILDAIIRTPDSTWFGYIPVAGWATMFFRGVVEGIISGVIISMGLFILLGILIISLLTAGSADYYEDVLLSTELTYTMKKAVKEGGNYQKKSNKKIKVKDEDPGIEKGRGAMTLVYKHILEMRRKSRFIFIDGYTIFICACTGIVGYNFKSNKIAAYAVLAFLIYLQFFITIMGSLKFELLKPYIYLIPEKSLHKVFAASLTSIMKPCVDAVCVFSVFTLVGGADPLTSIFLALAYSASGAVFVGLTILYQRVLGGQPNKIVQMFIGMIILVAVMTPAIVSSFLAAFLLPDAFDFMCTFPYTAFCVLFAFLMFKTCGNLIDHAEYTGKL